MFNLIIVLMKKNISFSALYLVIGLVVVFLSWAGIVWCEATEETLLKGITPFGNFLWMVIGAAASLVVLSALLSALFCRGKEFSEFYWVAIVLLGILYFGEVLICCYLHPSPSFVEMVLLVFLSLVINAVAFSFILLAAFVPFVIMDVRKGKKKL